MSDRKGIDYFPLDCHLDDKFKLIEAEFGLKGFAIVVKILQKIYAGEGYYCEWNRDISLLFARHIGLSSGEGTNLIDQVVTASIKRGIFSKELYEEFGILTSEGIQKRYLKIVARRTDIELDGNYLLISVDKNKVSVCRNEENVYINDKNVCRNAQRKVKESKGKESKECRTHTLTQAQKKELVDKYGQKLANEYIERTTKYKCCNINMIEKWILEDKQKKPRTSGNTKFNDFPQREYDYQDLEKKLLRSSDELHNK